MLCSPMSYHDTRCRSGQNTAAKHSLCVAHLGASAGAAYSIDLVHEDDARPQRPCLHANHTKTELGPLNIWQIYQIAPYTMRLCEVSQ